MVLTPSDIWSCSACTFENSIKDKECKVCLQAYDEEAGMAKALEESLLSCGTPSDIWSCSACTFENSIKDKQCKVCLQVYDEEAAMAKALEESLLSCGGKRCFVCGKVSLSLIRLRDRDCPHGACSMDHYIKLDPMWIEIKHGLRSSFDRKEASRSRSPRSTRRR